MRQLIAAVVFLAIAQLCSWLFSQTPSDAVGWAIADQAQLDEASRPFVRYLWIPPWLPEEGQDERHIAAVLSYAINEAASQTAIIVPLRVTANGWLLAVDLRLLASGEQLTTLAAVWDSLAVDEPYFHETKENAAAQGVKRIAIVAAHIRQDHARILNELNYSPSLVYRADWFLVQLLHQRYYGFMQYGKTQQEVYAGIGLNEKVVQQVGGDQRTAIFLSGITGKPRRIDRLQGAAGRFGTGAVWQTWDLFDESVEVKKHPLYNLLSFFPDGGEIIFERANGLHGYLLIDANRNLVAEAPPNLASDWSIPNPSPSHAVGTKRLVPAISCIRCHGAHDGLWPVGNDVQKLIASGTDVVDDLSNLLATPTEQVLRIAGLYTGNFSRRLDLGREDYELAVRRATQMPGIPEGMGVVETAALVSQIYEQYVFRTVDQQQFVLELGFPDAKLTEVLPATAGPTAGGFTVENVIVGSLRAGLAVRRGDIEQVYATARLRAITDE